MRGGGANSPESVSSAILQQARELHATSDTQIIRGYSFSLNKSRICAEFDTGDIMTRHYVSQVSPAGPVMRSQSCSRVICHMEDVSGKLSVSSRGGPHTGGESVTAYLDLNRTLRY